MYSAGEPLSGPQVFGIPIRLDQFRDGAAPPYAADAFSTAHGRVPTGQHTTHILLRRPRSHPGCHGGRLGRVAPHPRRPTTNGGDNDRSGGEDSRASHHAEVVEVEPGSDDARNQNGFVGQGNRGLPCPSRDELLRSLTTFDVGPENRFDGRYRLVAGTAEFQREGAAAVPKPQFVGCDGVPPRNLAGVQQEVDGRGGGSRAGVPVGVERVRRRPGFAVPTALRVRCKLQAVDES